MKIIIMGSLGRMGLAVSESAKNKHDIIPIDKDMSREFFREMKKVGDVLIDFSTPEITEDLCKYAKLTKTPLVIGTTGQNQTQIEKIQELSKSLPVFFSGNMSMGIAIFARHLSEIIRIFPNSEVDIIETHHTKKKDVPSGTALLLAKAVQSVNNGEIIVGVPCESRKPFDIHVLSRRMGNIVGEHTVVINTENEIFTLTHSAQNRKIFAEGALRASEFILTKDKGFYQVQDLI